MDYYVVEFYYYKPLENDSLILKNEFYFNKQGVSYRAPYLDPRKCFVLNQRGYDGFIRVLKYSKRDHRKKKTYCSEYIRFCTLFDYATDFVNDREIIINIENRISLRLYCDSFKKTIIIFKIELNEKAKGVVL